MCILNKLAQRQKKTAKGETVKAMEIFSIKHPAFYKEVLLIADNMDSPPDLTAINVPTIIIHGDSDSTISIKDSRRLLDYIPNAVFKTIKGGEHTLAYTRGEIVAGMISDHFAP